MSESKVRILLVEDDPATARLTRAMLEGVGYEIMGVASDKQAAIDMIQKNPPDLAIVDIMFNDEPDGIEVGAYIRRNTQIPFIFLTSHTHKTMIDIAKQVNPSAYLLKPFNKDLLYASIEVALVNSMNQVQNDGTNTFTYLFVKQKDSYLKVDINEIVYIEADDHYSHIELVGRRLTVRQSLSELFTHLDKYFIRIHKSYIANVRHIKSLKAASVVMQDDREVPIGRAFRADLVERLNLVS